MGAIKQQVDSPTQIDDRPQHTPPELHAPTVEFGHPVCSQITPSHIDSLPPELISIIANELVGDTASLKSLRLVNKACESASTRLLFQEIGLLINSTSMAHLHCILGNPIIRHAVTTLNINTAEYTDQNMDTFDWDDRDEELLKLFNHYLSRVGRLPNIIAVRLEFSKACVGPPLRRHWWASQVPESVGFRTEALQSLFKGLNDPTNPTPRFQSLTIKNLQDWDEDSLVKSANFASVMSKISQLELQIAIEHDEGSPTNFIEKKELHEFFSNQLSRDWLSPCAPNLTHLKLYAGSVHWGYIPKCILPHFPKLKSLILGKMTFTHDSQLDWVLSHSDTLQELVLDDCPIVIGAAWFGALDLEGYPVNTTSAMLANEVSTLVYSARWHDYFSAFRLRLHRLLRFGCGFNSTNWEEAIAFSESHTLRPTLWPERYRLFDTCWLERPPFATLNLEGELERGEYDGNWEGAPIYPDCTDRDLTELVKLREVICERAGVVDDELAVLQKILF